MTPERDSHDELARLEALLDQVPPPALSDRGRFVDRIMRRVALVPRLQPAAPVPWWIQAAADPAAALACLLMAILLWRPDAVAALTRLVPRGAGLLTTPPPQALAALRLDRPLVHVLFQLLGWSLVAWGSLELYRWSERLARRAASPLR